MTRQVMQCSVSDCTQEIAVALSIFSAFTGSSATDTGRSKSQLNLQDPVETIAWGGNLPSRRRAITGGLSGLAISKPLHPTLSSATSHVPRVPPVFYIFKL